MSPPRKFFVNKEELEELYVEKQLNSQQIGDIYNVHFSTVCKWLKKYNIPRRRPIDACINAMRYSPEAKGKIAESNSRREYSGEFKQRVSEMMIRLWQSAAYRSKQAKVRREGRGDRKHRQLILSEIKNLQQQGFRTIEADASPVPDIIAIKGDNLKVYAVEVESYGKGKPNYAKYDGCLAFDDIIWVIRRSKNGMG